MNFRMWALLVVSSAIMFACSARPTTPSLTKGEALPSGESAASVTSEAAPVVQSEVSDNRVAEMEKALKDQADAAQKVSEEKSTLEASVNAMANEVQAMNNQMASATSDEEKAGIESQISALEAEKTATEKKVAEMNANGAVTQKELDALKAEIEQLKKQLAAAKAGNTVVNNAAAAAAYYKFYYTGSKCLDVSGSSTADNALILGYNCIQKNLNQQFVYDLKGNYFFLKSRVSNKCVASTATTVSSPVVQRTCTNTTDKAWQWFGVNGTLGKLRNYYSGKCLGVNTAGQIVQSECNSIYAINFSFFKVQ